LTHLQQCRDSDPYCRFHVVVPEHVGVGWSDHEIRAEAEVRLDQMLDRMASMGMGATGEVSGSDVSDAVAAVVEREGPEVFAGIVLSTLPREQSGWWDVPGEIRARFPTLPLVHLVAEGQVSRAS
jgi:hypothetical protein